MTTETLSLMRNSSGPSDGIERFRFDIHYLYQSVPDFSLSDMCLTYPINKSDALKIGISLRYMVVEVKSESRCLYNVNFTRDIAKAAITSIRIKLFIITIDCDNESSLVLFLLQVG